MIDLGAVDLDALTRDELPALLGRVVELEARIRLRLATDIFGAKPPTSSRTLTAEEAAEIAGTTKRWLLAHTKGMKFRTDHSRKCVRLDEVGLRGWLAGRRRT